MVLEGKKNRKVNLLKTGGQQLRAETTSGWQAASKGNNMNDKNRERTKGGKKESEERP